MQKKFKAWKKELQHHLDKELLPFWLDRLWDEEHGGFLTQ
jgi:mannose/cellobiose epimerase-like protein (N-acyl-D-glucosamine 2-epimerase family)